MTGVSGGDRLGKVLERIKTDATRDEFLRVGFLEDATYPDGTPVAEVAAYNEFGTGTQPPRPFFRNAILEHKGDWAKEFGCVLKAADFDVALAYARMGELIKGDIQDSIEGLDSPPLAQSTIDRKGFDKPLVDTGHMQNSVDYDTRKTGT